MTTTAILHHIPDWLLLRCQPPEQCAESIQAILKALESNDRWVYAIRGEALRLFDERKLFTLFTDPAGDTCSCTYRFLQVYLPDSARYCQEALVSRQRLHTDVPLDTAANISRANLRVLEGASESVRRRPDVQQAAQTMTEKQFASKLSMEFAQHIEESQRFSVKLSGSDYQAVIAALDKVGELTNIEDRAGQLAAICIDFMLERQDELGLQSVCKEPEDHSEGKRTMPGLRTDSAQVH